MKKLIVILISILLLVCLVSCGEPESGNVEYEVLTVAPYKIITGKNDSGPVEEMRLAFIYMDNDTPKLIKDYHEIDQELYGNYIVISESNKYVIVNEYRNRTEYLYLTQETYDSLFPESEK